MRGVFGSYKNSLSRITDKFFFELIFHNTQAAAKSSMMMEKKEEENLLARNFLVSSLHFSSSASEPMAGCG